LGEPLREASPRSRRAIRSITFGLHFVCPSVVPLLSLSRKNSFKMLVSLQISGLFFIFANNFLVHKI
jgi:hypothetical protein